jgi:proline iminopeptidase
MDLEHWFKNIFYWIFSKRLFENKEALNDALRAATEYPYSQSAIAFEKQVKVIKEFDCRTRLPDIKAETLIIYGKEDLLFPPEENIRVLQKIPKTHLSIIEDAAHAIHMENPGAFTESIYRFLNNS